MRGRTGRLVPSCGPAVIPSERSETRDRRSPRGICTFGFSQRAQRAQRTTSIRFSAPAFHAEGAEHCTRDTRSARGGRGAWRRNLSARPSKHWVVAGEERCAGASSSTRKAVLCALCALCEKKKSPARVMSVEARGAIRRFPCVRRSRSAFRRSNGPGAPKRPEAVPHSLIPSFPHSLVTAFHPASGPSPRGTS